MFPIFDLGNTKSRPPPRARTGVISAVRALLIRIIRSLTRLITAGRRRVRLERKTSKSLDVRIEPGWLKNHHTKSSNNWHVCNNPSCFLVSGANVTFFLIVLFLARRFILHGEAPSQMSCILPVRLVVGIAICIFLFRQIAPASHAVVEGLFCISLDAAMACK